jgi:hypothetical protein
VLSYVPPYLRHFDRLSTSVHFRGNSKNSLYFQTISKNSPDMSTAISCVDVFDSCNRTIVLLRPCWQFAQFFVYFFNWLSRQIFAISVFILTSSKLESKRIILKLCSWKV